MRVCVYISRIHLRMPSRSHLYWFLALKNGFLYVFIQSMRACVYNITNKYRTKQKVAFKVQRIFYTH